MTNQQKSLRQMNQITGMIEMAEIDTTLRPPTTGQGQERVQVHSLRSLCLGHCVHFLLGFSHDGLPVRDYESG
jgi:hypothetical protein